MTEKSSETDSNSENKTNKFTKEQPLRHSLATVALDGDHLKINKQLYRVLVNKEKALDLEVLRQKYDPYLDQYDFVVGDISSEHLRLKGFYKDNVQTAIDRKEQTIADYLMEYCNPGGAFFILQLLSPVHHYRTSNRRKWNNFYNKHKLNLHNKKGKPPFKKYRVHQTRFKKPETVPIKKEESNRHTFVIKKRKASN